jgi:predicted methyltransferase
MEGSRPSPAVAAAIADAGRPAADTARDAARRPADLLVFAGVKPGDKVADLLPGGGYFTRLFSKIVGATGAVYALEPVGGESRTAGVMAKLAAEPAHANVRLVPLGAGTMAVPEPVDVLWTAQNYHDLHLAQLKLDVAAVNASFFNAVKPGGVFIVVDHAAAPGAPLSVADTLHRIDPAKARAEIEAAGFVFEGEIDVLRNPADPHTASAFDPSIRGKTDQFAYKFRKPA